MRILFCFIMVLPYLTKGQNPISTDGRPVYKTVSIFFGGGSYYIEEEEKKKVRDFFFNEILTNFEIHIHSHTDNIGGVKFNEWLSKMRSESAFNLLVDDGIPTNKVFIKDHGLYNPEFDNSTWDGRLKNRRVDIVLWPLPF